MRTARSTVCFLFLLAHPTPAAAGSLRDFLKACKHHPLDLWVDPIVRAESSQHFLPGSLDPGFADSYPYANRFTRSFKYADDIKNDGSNAFVTAGVNTDHQLQKVTSISGVPLETLEQRMVGTDHMGATAGAGGSEWNGIGNSRMRHSGPGLLRRGIRLRELLRRDNKFVRGLGLSHQQLAEPLLEIINTVEKQGGGKVVVDGQAYFVGVKKMGGQFHLSRFLKFQRDERDRLHSGWIGYGTQGSPFRDELFANWEMTLTDKDGRTLKIDALTPYLIHRYGFYQGGPFRVEPQSIIDFFHLTLH